MTIIGRLHFTVLSAHESKTRQLVGDGRASRHLATLAVAYCNQCQLETHCTGDNRWRRPLCLSPSTLQRNAANNEPTIDLRFIQYIIVYTSLLCSSEIERFSLSNIRETLKRLIAVSCLVWFSVKTKMHRTSHYKLTDLTTLPCEGIWQTTRI